MTRKRQNNIQKFIILALTMVLLILVATAAFLIYKGKIPLDIIRSNKTQTAQSTSGIPTPADTTKAAAETTTEPAKETMPAESTNPSDLMINWKNPSSFVSSSKLGDGSIQKAFKDGSKIRYWISNNIASKVAFGSGQMYSELEGVTAFRGNNYRTAPSWGTRDVKEKKLEIVWTHDTGAISAENSYWPGAGWTGQPLIVHWPDKVRNIMNINADLKKKDLKEVIYPILDGNVYFLDLETGKSTRPNINIGYTIKGTGMIDPRGYPLFYTGMGLNTNGKTKTSWKYRIINLINQKEIFSLPGSDPFAFRTWGAFDSSGLLNRYTDTLINCGENGLVYKTKLNTKFDEGAGTISINPQVTKYRYKTTYTADQGIENSPAFYRNLMYFADNGGNLQCLDINKMEPVWIYNLGDDTDCTTTIEETSDGVFLYTANEIDKRNKGAGSKANCNVRKFNALTGELVWQKDYSCVYQYYINGGSLATPVIGKDDISDMVIFNIALTGSTADGTFVALDKKTGQEIWKRHLNAYSWSSPVDFKSSDGKTYVIFCDFKGDMHLMDPKTGKDLDVISVGGNVEASPSIYNDMAVVGTYAKKIYGVRIK